MFYPNALLIAAPVSALEDAAIMSLLVDKTNGLTNKMLCAIIHLQKGVRIRKLLIV